MEGFYGVRVHDPVAFAAEEVMDLQALPITDELKRLNDFLDWLKAQADPQTVQRVKDIIAKVDNLLQKVVQ